MSQPPDYPGRQRFKRVASAAGSEAYQGAFEAIGSVLIAGAFGYWVDYRWDTTPVGLLVGTGVGFAAMVLRLIRLGKEIHPDSNGSQIAGSGTDDLMLGESPGMSSVLRDERDEFDEGDESSAARESKSTNEERE